MTSRVCPKCGKDFTTNPYWTTDLRRHLARKNPCDRPADWKFIRNVPVILENIRCLDSIEWKIPGTPNPDFSKEMITRWFFTSIMNDKLNVCFVKPNKSKNEIWVKIRKNEPVKVVKLDEFIQLFVNHVIMKYFPKNYEEFWKFDEWLYAENFINLESGVWNGEFPDIKPEFMIVMRRMINEFTETYPNKTQLKNLIVSFI